MNCIENITRGGIRKVIPVILLWVITLSVAAVDTSDSFPEIRAIEPRPDRIEVLPGDDFQIEIWTDRRTYYLGDSVRIYFRANRDAYVYIYDIDPTGETRLLFPNWYDRNNQVRARRTYSIPDYRYDLKITGPTGKEYLHMIAVRNKQPFIDRYYRFSPQNPFPDVDKGPKALLRELKEKEQAERMGDQPYIQRKDEHGLQRIQPVPEPVPPYFYNYAEDMTSIYVRQRYWEPPYWDDYPEWDDDYYEPGYGSAIIRSSPSGARIYIDGRYMGISPRTIKLREGWHLLRLNRSGYFDWTERFHVARNERAYIHANMNRRSSSYWRYDDSRSRERFDSYNEREMEDDERREDETGRRLESNENSSTYKQSYRSYYDRETEPEGKREVEVTPGVREAW